MTDWPRCETCKWWMPAAGASWGRCARASRPGALMEADAPVPASLDTSREFGCVEHTPKENQ